MQNYEKKIKYFFWKAGKIVKNWNLGVESTGKLSNHIPCEMRMWQDVDGGARKNVKHFFKAYLGILN